MNFNKQKHTAKLYHKADLAVMPMVPYKFIDPSTYRHILNKKVYFVSNED